MTFITFRSLCWLLFIVTVVSAADQHIIDSDLTAQRFPYICENSLPSIINTYPPCCNKDPGCSRLCPGVGSHARRYINATDSKTLHGRIYVILPNGGAETVQAAADLTTHRDFISDSLVRDLGLNGNIDKFTDVDVHNVEIFGRNVTISTFVKLSIRTGIDEKVVRDKVFEIIPENRSRDGNLATPNLVLGRNFLYDAGALAINEALFFTDDQRRISDHQNEEL